MDFELGDGLTIPIEDQERIAIEYLAGNREALRSLAQIPSVTHFGLWLHCRREKTKRNLYAFTIDTSSSLIWHVLDIGCALSHFVSLEYLYDDD